MGMGLGCRHQNFSSGVCCCFVASVQLATVSMLEEVLVVIRRRRAKTECILLCFTEGFMIGARAFSYFLLFD